MSNLDANAATSNATATEAETTNAANVTEKAEKAEKVFFDGSKDVLIHMDTPDASSLMTGVLEKVAELTTGSDVGFFMPESLDVDNLPKDGSIAVYVKHDVDKGTKEKTLVGLALVYIPPLESFIETAKAPLRHFLMDSVADHLKSAIKRSIAFDENSGEVEFKGAIPVEAFAMIAPLSKKTADPSLGIATHFALTVLRQQYGYKQITLSDTRNCLRSKHYAEKSVWNTLEAPTEANPQGLFVATLVKFGELCAKAPDKLHAVMSKLPAFTKKPENLPTVEELANIGRNQWAARFIVERENALLATTAAKATEAETAFADLLGGIN